MGVAELKGLSAEIEKLPEKSLAYRFPEPPTFGHFCLSCQLAFVVKEPIRCYLHDTSVVCHVLMHCLGSLTSFARYIFKFLSICIRGAKCEIFCDMLFTCILK